MASKRCSASKRSGTVVGPGKAPEPFPLPAQPPASMPLGLIARRGHGAVFRLDVSNMGYAQSANLGDNGYNRLPVFSMKSTAFARLVSMTRIAACELSVLWHHFPAP